MPQELSLRLWIDRRAKIFTRYKKRGGLSPPLFDFPCFLLCAVLLAEDSFEDFAHRVAG